MKRRKKKPVDPIEIFQSTCGWCGKNIPPDVQVFGGGGKVRPGMDISDKAGQVIALRFAGVDKTVLIAVSTLDSEARRAGHDFVYMACSAACATALRSAFLAEIELGKRMGLPGR
jgi:hypothetical protein